jgi:hypothetical protein
MAACTGQEAERSTEGKWQLNRALATLTVEKQILNDIAEGNF